jgi:putative oxidoreductase
MRCGVSLLRGRGLAVAAPLGQLMIRIPLGVIFIAHGSQKLFGLFGGRGLTATLNDYERFLGIPPFLTAIGLAVEFFGGIAVLIGVATRTAALGLAILMLVAIARVHWANGFFINWTLTPGRGHGIEMNLALLGMSLALVTGGAGWLAIDRE